jgi:hypothetical protein
MTWKMCSLLLNVISQMLGSIDLLTAAEMIPLLGLSQDVLTQATGCSACLGVRIMNPGFPHTIVTSGMSVTPFATVICPLHADPSMRPGLFTLQIQTPGKQPQPMRRLS